MNLSFKNIFTYLPFVALCTILSSCYIPDLGKYASISPYSFDFKPVRSDVRVSGYILSHLDSVEVMEPNSLRLLSGGKVILGTYRITQITGEFVTTLVRGNGIRFILRSDGDTINHRTALRFDYTSSGCTVLQGNEILLKNDAVRAIANKPEIVRITNDGQLCRIIVGCETVFEKKINSALTEYITVESIHDSEVLLTEIEFYRLFPERLLVVNEAEDNDENWIISLFKALLRLI